VPYVQKHGKNPVTGADLDTSQLLRLKISSASSGEPYCPITGRPFSDHSHIVANRKSGHVYSQEGLDRLGSSVDFFTNEPYRKADILSLQDPKNLQQRNTHSFNHVREGIEQKPLKSSVKTVSSSGKLSGSVTSTSMMPSTIQEELEPKKKVSNEASMFAAASSFSSSGKLTIRTNLGDLHFELFCSRAPKACYNLIQLSKKGYYANVAFHRLIAGFMVQGGDPTGTGSGGSSCWGKPFETERSKSTFDQKGILAMANKAGQPKSNTSQFFITFDALSIDPTLYTIFGKLLEGNDVLDRIEAIPTNEADRPLKPIIIRDMIVLDDPFQQYMDAMQARKRRSAEAPDPIEIARNAHQQKNTVSSIGRYLKGKNK